MNLQRVAASEKGLGARKVLLGKEVTRAPDMITTQRRELPMVRVEKEHLFGGPNGTLTSLDLFTTFYNYLDITVLERQEDELEHPWDWWRLKDQYGDENATGPRDNRWNGLRFQS